MIVAVATWVAALLLTSHALAASSSQFLWLDPSGRPSASAEYALRLLSEAPADGLTASDYQTADLAERAAILRAANASTLSERTAFEDGLDSAMQRYLRDLRTGRVDPRSVGFRVRHPQDAAPDFAALLHSATAQLRLPELVAELRPRMAQYARLREALARYRALAADRSIGRLSIAVPVRPGDAFDGAVALHRLLVALGDLPPDAALSANRYDAALAQGVMRFQGRHGLPADGVIGRATLTALNVPLAQRVQQLELALERLRWLPEFDAGRFIGINIPMFRLWAWDTARPAAEPVGMAVVVGKALNTRTPVLADSMRFLIIRPYWNVPRSILTHELLPAIARDSGYLQRNDMEIVYGAGDDARAVTASAENLALLRQGTLRVRQRPGAKNSLGLVKFVFPNDDNIYLHDTPATQLFGEARRDFSHGCVRLEDPVALAEWVLNDQPQWTRNRIEQAMVGSMSLRVNLSRPIPVILFYMTAMVMPSDQTLHFAPDIYGHDATLLRALKRSRPAP
jgi:murein L,D-transpeptidase YcbB/YkuD